MSNDTGYDLPAGAIVHECLIQVLVPESTAGSKGFSCGLLHTESGGNKYGFLTSRDVSVAGVFRGTVPTTTGIIDGFGASSIGAYFYEANVAGSSTDDRGLFIPRPHLTDRITAKSVVYIYDEPFTEFTGRIWLLISEFPSS